MQKQVNYSEISRQSTTRWWTTNTNREKNNEARRGFPHMACLDICQATGGATWQLRSTLD